MSEALSRTSHARTIEPTEYVTRNDREVADLALELLRFDTQNPPGETTGVSDWIATYFDGLDIETEWNAVKKEKPNLLATLPGETDCTLLCAVSRG